LVGALLAICAGCATEDARTPPVTTGDDPSTKTAIEREWYYSPEAAEACDQILEFRADLKADGTVERVQLMAPRPLPASCGPAAEYAQRAIIKASPLQGTKGVSAIVLRFDYGSLQ
jgi:hypothetical protein